MVNSSPARTPGGARNLAQHRHSDEHDEGPEEMSPQVLEVIYQQHGLPKRPRDDIRGGAVFGLLVQEFTKCSVRPQEGPYGRRDESPDFYCQPSHRSVLFGGGAFCVLWPL